MRRLRLENEPRDFMLQYFFAAAGIRTYYHDAARHGFQ